MATIEKVFSTKTSKTYFSAELFSKYDEKTLFNLRRDLKDKKKGILLCATCFQPLFLAGNINQELHFRHKKDSDDCPIKTTSNLSKEEVDAMKFNGQKEGAEHKQNKLFIASILRRDPSFENVEVEKTFKEESSSGIAKHWRRPDVSAIFKNKGLKIVFELQVSTTFLDVIIDRDNFYQRSKASILWVFLEFNNNTFTQKDIFYSSNMNAFVLDNEAKEMSENTGV
jgi:competence CoiA-like predicted nuclease